MHKCEFCGADYTARAQVKKPRACPMPSCQVKRQRINERDWRVSKGQVSDPEYHRIRRRERLKRLGEIVQVVLNCVEVGSRFLNRPFDSARLSQVLMAFVSDLGLRRANKLCRFQFGSDFGYFDQSEARSKV